MSIGMASRSGADVGLVAYANALDATFSAELFNSLVTSVSDAGGGLSFSRSTTATVVDQDSVVRTAKINEARFPGLRRVENLLTYSEDFSNAAWVKSGTATVSPNTVVAPDGLTTVDTLNLPAGSDRINNSPASITGGNTYVFSVWLSGSGTVNLTLSTSGGAYTYGTNLITLTSIPTRYSLTLLTVSGNTGLFCVVGRYDGIGSSGTATSVNIWGAQLENVTGQTVQTVGEYVSTNVLNTPGINNLLSYSEAFDNGVWSGGSLTVSPNAIASPIGGSTADKLVESTAVSAYHYINESITKAASALQYTGSVYVKDAGRNVQIILSENGGSSGAVFAFNPATGATVAAVSAYGSMTNASYTLADVGGGWWRVSITATTGAFAALALQITLSSGVTTVYTGDGVSGAYVWGAQLVAGPVLGAYSPTNVTNAPYHGAGVDGVKYLTTTLAGAPLSGKFLSEPARTNLLIRSQEFDNAAWIKTVYTVSANAVTAPDGTLTADKLDEATTASTDRYIAEYGAAITASAITTVSVYVKDAGRGYCQIRLANGNGTFSTCYYSINLSTLATVGSGAIAGTLSSVSVTPLSNGWIRLTVSGTLAADVTLAGIQVFGYNGSSTTYAGVVGYGFYIWGAQLEAGNKASSYIPTVAATVTRAADSLTYPVTASPTQGGFSCTLIPAEAPATAGTYPGVGLIGAAGHYIGVFIDPVGSILYLATTVAGVGTSYLPVLTASAGTTYKVAVSWDSSRRLAVSVNGAAVLSTTASSMPATLATFFQTLTGNVWNGQLSDVKVFNQTLSDTTLRQLTT